MVHESNSTSASRVAVIAVHGISDQKPYESARAIADLLLSQTDPAQSQYVPFQEQDLRIPVTPLRGKAKIPKTVKPSQSNDLSISPGLLPTLSRTLTQWANTTPGRFIKWLWQTPDERGIYLRQLLDAQLDRSHSHFTEPSYLFIRDQIRRYRKKSVYQSICLEGQCTPGPPLLPPHLSQGTPQSSVPTPPIKVDIYEMYWADLSRLGSGFVRIFGEFYQLLFHLGSLGRQSVDLLRVEHQRIQPQGLFRNVLNIWAWYSAAQTLAARILSLFLPILNLFLLVFALSSLPGNLTEPYATFVTAVSNGLLLLVALSYGLLATNRTRPWPWLLLPFGAGVLGAFTLPALVKGEIPILGTIGLYRWMAIEWGLGLNLAIWIIPIKPYSRHRPGADIFAIAVAVVLFPVAWGLLGFSANTHAGITQASLYMVEIIYTLLLAGWFVFLLLYFAALAFGAGAIATLPRQSEQRAVLQRAKRAAWTARFSLALPALLFSLLTLSLWTALTRVGGALLPDRPIYLPLLFFRNPQFPFQPAQFAQRLTVFSGSTLALPIMGLVVVAIALILWALVPAILTESFPPDPRTQQATFSEGLGNWLSQGFALLLGPGDWIVAWLIPLLFLVGTLDGISLLWGREALLVTLFPTASTVFNSTEGFLNWVAAALTASATGLIAFGGRLNQLSLGLRGVLDAALDVDNYLRLHPLDDNPSARIYARYTSLLRYLSQRLREDGTPYYNSFVIVAHSQGTVISADLLRFLQQDPDPALARLHQTPCISLFTMGSPLRQLYSFGFPHLYQWVSQDAALPQSVLTPLSDTANPDPQALLGVKKWVNTFRSGDYVGRYLWRSDAAAAQWHPVHWQGIPSYLSEDSTATRREFCLGAGAHTHYWDETAPAVAQELDRLIRG